MPSERTPLQSGGPAPSYVFMTNPNRVYRNKIRQFQCCVCAAILTVFVAAVVITVSYSVNHDTEDDDNSTTPILPPSEQLMSLLKLTWPLADSSSPAWNDPSISPGELEAAIEVGQARLRDRDQLEELSPSLELNSPSFKHSKAVGTSPKATELARSGYVMDVATKQIMAERRTTPGGSVGCGPKLDADWLPQEVCRDSLDVFSSCPPTPYRSVDGSCNNPVHPLKWGVAMRPFRRTIPADYADGVSEPRVSVDGSPLPSAREVSVTVHRPLYKDDPDFTVMLAVWGQFIDHDITATALSQKSNGKTISCCHDGQWTGTKLHPECFPVQLANGDPFYQQYNLTCMEFVRSAPAPTCRLGAREQLNQASSFLDGSVVYGNTPELTSSLRRFVKGQLRMLVTEDGRTLLPISEDPNDGCNRAEMNAKGRYCFLSGDSRANENMHLTSMHLLWARQHNAIATRLAAMNPTWDDERLFQETRRIVSAQMEHITYNEFLPILFGQTMMDHLELAPKKAGYDAGYDVNVDPSIANSFAASAFRFAHTLLPGLMKVLANDTSSADYVEMHKILFNPYMLYKPGYLDGTLKGLVSTDILKVDPHVSSEHLFETLPTISSRPAPCGLDLVSLNIQRGRDHGLPSYPAWREHCGLSKPTSFSDLNEYMDEDSVERISTIYKSVDDIDAYTGMLSEAPLEGGIIGPTITCILGDQFLRLKKGDRYWYETSEQPQAFTPEQLEEIRKTTLAKVLCDTSDSVGELQRLVMRSVTGMNPRVPCSELPEPDLSKWREVQGSYVQAGIGRVKMAGSNVHIAPPTTVNQVSAPGVPREPGFKTYAVGATVMGGRISTAGGTAWSGDLPLALPVSLFDTVDNSGTIGTNTIDPSKLGHGIVWEGTLSTDAYGYANFEGRFSIPRYIHGNGIQQFAVKWLNGDFTFYTKLTWDSTRFIPIKISGKYSSPVYLQERVQYQYLKEPSTAPPMSSFYDVSSGFGSLPTIENGPGVYRSPCILHGAYSADRKSFLWSGNLTLIVPNAVPADTWANYWTPTNEMGVFKRSSLLTSSKSGAPAPAVKTTTAVGVTVASGSVTASLGGSSPVTWWSGKFPVAIPVPIFNRVLTSSVASGSVVFGTGISWSGSSIATGPMSSDISGTFSLPIYVHGPGANFSIQWWEGNFLFQTQSLWNATLNGAFLPGTTYSSPIYFRAPKGNATVQTVLERSEEIDDHPVMQLLAMGGGGPGLMPKVPIILHGNYTPDKTQFYWTGNVTFILPTAPPPSPSLINQLNVKSQYKLAAPASNIGAMPDAAPSKSKSFKAVGTSVTSGSVMANSGGADPIVWWTGNFPVAIPIPVFNRVATTASGSETIAFGSGISWSGSVSPNGASGSMLSGSFSLPVYAHGPGANFSIKSWTGNFSLQYITLWNTTLDGAVMPGVTYITPIYFRQSKTSSDLHSVIEDFTLAEKINDSPGASLYSSEVSVGGPKMPIILHGYYSLDKTQFFWQGNATFLVPMMPPSPADIPEQMIIKTSSYSMSPMSPATSASKTIIIGGTVSSGSVSTAGGNVWSGELPVSIPLPLFDSVTTAGALDTDTADPPVFGNGILWDGMISLDSMGTANVQGSYSLPTFVHGNGLANFSIKWLNGNFMFKSHLSWNSSLGIPPSLSGKYSSPVYLHAKKEFEYLKYTTPPKSLKEASNEFVSMPNVVNDAGVLKAPLILLGTYSVDKTMFIWSGNYSLIIPSTVPAPPHLPYVGLLKSTSKPGGTPAKSKSSMAVGVSVMSGSVTASSEGSDTVTLWNGTFPAALPVPLFNRVLTAGAGAGTIVFGSGVSWSGSITPTGDGGSVLSGPFSLPVYNRGPGANFSIQWWKGQFSLQFNNLWNATLDSAVLPGVTYSSAIYFRQAKSSDTMHSMMMDYNAAEKLNDGSVQTTAAGTGGPKIPIILHGNYSPDKTQFYWLGNMTVIVPLTAGPPSVMKSKAWLSSSFNEGIIPAKPVMKPLALGATVMGGYISTTSGSAWSGELPVALPVPLFDSVYTPGDVDTETTDPPVYGHGILWDGTASTDSTGGASFEGRFSMPKFIHGNGMANFTMKWLSGSFMFYTKLAWNSNINVPITVSGIYSSPVYLQEGSQYEYLKDPSYASMIKSFSDVSGGFTSEPSISYGPGVFRSPCVLHGTYTPDRKTFLWSGNITLIVPNAIPVNMWPDALYLPRATGISLLKKSTWLQSQGSSGATTAKGMAVGLSMISGKVTASSDGSGQVTWWDGTLPTALPVPLFNKVVTASGLSGAVVFGTGVTWSGMASTNMDGVSILQGTFSLPVYTRGPAAMFSIQWWNGDFSFQANTLWNKTLNNMFTPGVTYSSPVYLRVGAMDDSPVTSVSADDNPIVQFITSVKGDMSAEPKAPIILHGTYSPDKTQFWWSGNATLIIPSPSLPPIQLIRVQNKMASPVNAPKSVTSGKVTLGATVTSGSIVAKSDSSGPTMWWNGELPVAIHFTSIDDANSLIDSPPSFVHAVSWHGTLTRTSVNEVLLQGTFSMPRYTRPGGSSNFSIEWYTGEFSFQMSLLWNSTLDGLVAPGETYSSSIYLYPILAKSDSSFVNWDQMMPNPSSDNLIHFIAKSQQIITGSSQVPIVLQGKFSPDKSAFLWTGNVLISFPTSLNVKPAAPSYLVIPKQQAAKDGKPGKPAKPAKPAKPVKPKTTQTIGVSVVSGSIEAGLDGVNSSVMWDGQIPITFPLPATDSLTTVPTAPALSQDITWSGTLMSGPGGDVVWEGQFSLPSFTQKNGVYEYSTPMWMGHFSFNMNTLWKTTVDGLVKPGVTYTSHVRLINYGPKKKSTLVTDIDDDMQPDTPLNPTSEPPPEPIPDVVPSTEAPAPKENPKVQIMLQGYTSPDKTSFQWIGRAILFFPIAM